MEQTTEVAAVAAVPEVVKLTPPLRLREEQRARILDLLAKQDLTHEEIAQVIGVSTRTVSRIRKEFAEVFPALEEVSGYRSLKSDLLAAGQMQALKSAFSGKKLEKAGFLSTLQGFEILNKAERLENGQSTENVNTKVFGAVAVTHLSGNIGEGDKS